LFLVGPNQLAQLGFSVCIGAHTGEIELADNEVRGMAVHIASRVAHPAALSPTEGHPGPLPRWS